MQMAGSWGPLCIEHGEGTADVTMTSRTPRTEIRVNASLRAGPFVSHGRLYVREGPLASQWRVMGVPDMLSSRLKSREFSPTADRKLDMESTGSASLSPRRLACWSCRP